MTDTSNDKPRSQKPQLEAPDLGGSSEEHPSDAPQSETPTESSDLKELRESFKGIYNGEDKLRHEFEMREASKKFEGKFKLQEYRKMYDLWEQSLKKPDPLNQLFPRFWKWTGIGEKKGWDFLQLLVAPIVLAVIGLGLQQYVKEHDEQQAIKKSQQDQKLADDKAQQDRQLADDKAKQDTLVKYLDQMADSLKDGVLAAKPGEKEFIVAQAKTVIALQSLDKNRQHLIIQFLQASGLNQVSDKTKPDEYGKVMLGDGDRVLLYKAQMSKANLANSDLSGSVLIEANLEGANLGCISPTSIYVNPCSDLTYAKLFGARLYDAFLGRADLSHADFSHADLRYTNLSNADLTGANLSNANLTGTNLSHADLSGANLSGAILLTVDLSETKSLTLQQLEGAASPLLCKVKFPKEITTVDPDRDCKKLPEILVKRYPEGFKNLAHTQTYVDKISKP